MKTRVLFIYSGSRLSLNKSIQEKKAPDTQKYGMNHFPSDFWVDSKEFSDTPFRAYIGRFIGFRARHFLMYFRTRNYNSVYGQSLIYTAFLKRLFFGRSKFILLNTSLNRILSSNRHRFFSYVFLQWSLCAVDTIVCFSHFQLEQLKNDFQIPSNKLIYIPFGTDTSFYKPIFDGRKKYILSVGRDNGRDYKTVIAVAEAMPEYEFQIVASKRNLNNIIFFPKNVIIFYDLVPDESRKKYEEAAALLLTTYSDGYVEGSDCSGQTVLLDAFASGLPVIVTKKSYLDDYGLDKQDFFSVSVGDVAAIIEKIKDLPVNGLRVARQARNNVEQYFSTELLGKRLAAISEKIVIRD